MKLYNEIKSGKRSSFEKVLLDDGGDVVSRRRVTCPLFTSTYSGFDYLVLYDDDMTVIQTAFDYLNFDIGDRPLSTRRKSAYALRTLHCFLSLENRSLEELDSGLIKDLGLFLRGIGGVHSDFQAETMRSAETVNDRLSVYRDYYKCRDIECDALFRSREVRTPLDPSGLETSARLRFDSSLPVPRKDLEVPAYISPDEYARLFALATQAGDECGALLMHLMYHYGFRIGELLGATTEDVREIRRDGEAVPALVLRNRMSDRGYQHAKNLPHPRCPAEYATRDYKDASSEVVLTKDTYRRLVAYVNDVHEEAMSRYPSNYDKGKADIVSSRNAPESNHYLFLNRYGRVLSADAWGDRLKHYFADAGLHVDQGVRRNNLSHRFRHGFAMYHAHFSDNPRGIVELKDMMRHRSVSSTMVYFNPSFQDQLEAKTRYQEDMYSTLNGFGDGVFR